MDNNDILIRLRYALDIKDKDMVEIFKLGGIDLTQEEMKKMLTKLKDAHQDDTDKHVATKQKEYSVECKNSMLESFLNGFIIFKRGRQEPDSGQPEVPALSIKDNESVNNALLKKLKIALSLTSEDMIDLFKKADVTVTKGELSAMFRKEDHKHYRACGDSYARSFLKGLVIRNRKIK